MASLREEARKVLDEARDGILWIAVWKTGRSWHCDTILGVDYTESNSYLHCDEHFDFSEEALEELTGILADDPNAILVNGYYRNIGPMEEMTLASLVDGLRFQYELGGNLQEIFLSELAECAETPELKKEFVVEMLEGMVEKISHEWDRDLADRIEKAAIDNGIDIYWGDQQILLEDEVFHLDYNMQYI